MAVSLESALDRAVYTVWSMVLGGGADNVGAAVDLAWNEITIGFSDDDFEALAIRGMKDLAMLRAHPTTKRASPTVPYGSPHGGEWERYATLSFPYLGVERQKMLIDFTVADWEAFEARMEVAVASASARVQMARRVREILIAKGKPTVRALDAKTKDGIEDLARSTLRTYDSSLERES